MPGLAGCRKELLERLAIRHKVSGLLAAAILRTPAVPQPWIVWAMMADMARERDRQQIEKSLKKAINLIGAIAEPPIVLKGASLSFGTPRDEGDIDLLIREKDLLPIIELLESKGYTYVGYERNLHIRKRENRRWDKLKKWSNQFEFKDTESGTLIELHTAFFETARVYDENLSRLKKSVPDFWAASSIDAETGNRYLCIEDRFLLLALHVVLKRSPVNKSFILRHLTDYTNLVSHTPDWKRLAARARHFGLEFHLAALIALCERYTGALVPAEFQTTLNRRLGRGKRWLKGLFCRILIDIDSYDRWHSFLYRLSAPFILKGSLKARLKTLFIVPHALPRAYQLTADYGLPDRSRMIVFLYLLEPMRFTVRVFLRLRRMLIDSVRTRYDRGVKPMG